MSENNKKEMTFRDLQEQQKAWVEHNFPGRPDWNPLLGAMEELGELAHAHLKEFQKIRKQDYVAKGKDAVGDIFIYLSDYCSARGWDMQEIIETTWGEVKTRDWKKYPKNGRTE